MLTRALEVQNSRAERKESLALTPNQRSALLLPHAHCPVGISHCLQVIGAANISILALFKMSASYRKSKVGQI
jgi:hypothetical protein